MRLISLVNMFGSLFSCLKFIQEMDTILYYLTSDLCNKNVPLAIDFVIKKIRWLKKLKTRRNLHAIDINKNLLKMPNWHNGTHTTTPKKGDLI